MWTIDIMLNSVSDVQDFVSLAYNQPFEVAVTDGRSRVNGKSFMQMFCLDLSKPQRVAMDCTREMFEQFLEAAKRFLI